MSGTIFVGGGGEGYAEPQELLMGLMNRHGLVTGATGTGKTVTLQIITESLSAAGVPVFHADIKGDMAGMVRAGDPSGKMHDAFMSRAETIGYDLHYQDCPVTFWDIFGEQGHPVRATVAEMGPLLLARLLQLNDVQEGVLNVAFRVADDEGLALLDLEDLQALLQWCGQNTRDLSLHYGNVTVASIGAIQRALLMLENQGGKLLFGEPALDLADLMRVDEQGRGVVNILAADQLMNSPRLYATFLLWLLSELFESLPEVGDPEKPKLVFFFDEAHLLFKDAPKPLLEKVVQVVRLIRSRGVGVWFATQHPVDVPDAVLAQLGNRVQHALRTFTANDRAALEKAARTYRDNPRFDIATAISEVGTGEAVTSFLDRKGAPGISERTLIRPPATQLGPLTDAQRRAIIAASPMGAKYDTRINRESAYEILSARAARDAQEAEAPQAEPEREFSRATRFGGSASRAAPQPKGKKSGTSASDFGEALASAAVKELRGTTGRRLIRGLFGTITRR